MIRVTLYVETPDGRGRKTEMHEATSDGPYVLPLVFRVVNAVVGTHAHEVAAATAAVKLISDAIAAAAPAAEDVPG